MLSSAALSLLILAPGQDQDLPKVPSFDAFQIVEVALDGPSWRPWVKGIWSRTVRSVVSSATVEVEDSLERDRQLRLLEFRARTAPQLRAAFDVGYAFRTNVQMLAEVMLQDPAHPHPPSIPTVFYNNFKPPLGNPAFQVQAANSWSRYRVSVNVKKEAQPGR